MVKIELFIVGIFYFLKFTINLELFSLKLLIGQLLLAGHVMVRNLTPFMNRNITS